MEPAKTFPIYQLMDAFEAFCAAEPDAKAQHRSLYYFLLAYCRRRGNTPRFSMPYETGMHGSKIGSWKTYDEALKALHGWGFIEYAPGANRYKSPVVAIQFRNPTDDVLLTYWQSYCISTANPSADVPATIKEVLNKEINDVGAAPAPAVDLASPLKAKTPDNPRGRPSMLPDESPLFTLAGLRAFAATIGFAAVDIGYYLPMVQRAAEKTGEQRPTNGPGKTWEDFVTFYFANERKHSRVVYPAPAAGQSHAGPNAALQVTTTSTSFNVAARAAEQNTNLYL